MVAYPEYAWLIALISICFVFSCLGNGANDVANSYATAVGSRTLSMKQAGVLAVFTEFFGAVVLGSRVTSTIKGNIMDTTRFESAPAVMILVMACAEFGSAIWLMSATHLGFPVSTTQTVVGAIVGVGIAAEAAIKWGWAKGSVSQIAASWFISPVLAAIISAILYATVKYLVLVRKDPLKWALRLIPFYVAFTASVLAFFVVVEEVDGETSTGTIVGIVLGVFGAALILSYIFFYPYVHRRLVKMDSRLRYYHIILGPLLWMEDPPIFWPSKSGIVVHDYYRSTPVNEDAALASETAAKLSVEKGASSTAGAESHETSIHLAAKAEEAEGEVFIHPRERYLQPTAHLPWYAPARIWSYIKFGAMQGVTRDVHSKSSNTQGNVVHYDNRVEHLWTYTQCISAMIMSVAHGSNDVANALGPWVGAYNVYTTGEVESTASTPVFIIVVAGLLLGAGFWLMGYKIVRAMGSQITQVSPTRGYCMEVGTTITILMASYLGIPVSTTMCKTGATIGVALMNGSFKAVNWKQVAWIFSGWLYTLPAAGLIGGLLAAAFLNAPQF